MRRLSCSVLVGVLVLAAGALAEEARECTVTVQPGQSIQAAIAGAQEGAVICLGEGSWQENLKIEKALTLRGQGAQKTVIDGIQEGYPVVWVVGAQPIEVKLEGLGVTGAEGECAGWPICAFGALIQGTAQVEISGSTISKNVEDGIELFDSAQVKITGSTISENRDGIMLFDSAQAEITGSTISGNGDDGIELWDSAQAKITNSTISENEEAGIVLEDSAQAEITNNLIRGNGWAGIASSSDGPVTGSKNRMQENGVDLVGNLPAGLRLPLVEATKQEIRLPDPAYPSLQHAVDALLPGGRLILARGAYAGGVTIDKDLTLEALEGAEARLEGGTAVISLVGAARVKLTGLLLGGSFSAFFGLVGGATVQVEITGSTISGNRWHGIVLWDSAQAKITNSTISGNREHGIKLSGSARAEISGSTISGNREHGIVLWDSAQAKITDSTISKNSSGIGLGDTAQAKITGSTISENGAGIVLRGTAQAEISNNLIQGNGGAGIASFSDGPVTGSKNRMQENGVDLVGNLPAGLRLPLVEATKQEIRLPDPAYPSLQHAVDALLPGGRLILGRGAYAGGVTIDKDLTLEALEGAEARLEGGAAVISLVGAARVKLAGLILTGGRSYGLAGGATVQVEITGSTISENGDGIVLWDSAQAEISNSTVSKNSTGIWLLGTARAEITDSTISKNSSGIELFDSAQVKITGSTISENWTGIRLLGTAQAKITDSTISENWIGIELSGSAQAEITNSTISGNELEGIELFDSAQAKITSSTISENGAKTGEDGIRLSGSAQAEITSSTISGNKRNGIVLEGTAQVEITTSTISDNGADGIHLQSKAILRLTESHLLRNQGYGVRAYLPDCVEDYRSELRFTGEVSGRGNTIPGPPEPDGNKKGAVCPAELAFLMTKEGGKYP